MQYRPSSILVLFHSGSIYPYRAPLMSTVTANETRNQDATLYVGDLDVRVNEALLWELMLQVGPVGSSITSRSVDPMCPVEYSALRFLLFPPRCQYFSALRAQ